MRLTHIKALILRMGIDKAIAYSSGARIIQAVSGVVSIFFIANFLSKEEQGFFFTFGSITAIQVFFELGFTTVLMQFVSHEMAALKYNEKNELEGDERKKSRLSSLIHFTLKWYSWVAVILILVLIIVGEFFFHTYNKNANVNWEMPWILTAVSVCTKLVLAPFQSILMGLGKIKDVTKMQFGQQLITPIATLGGLALGWNLYVVGIGMLASSLYCMVYMYSNGLLRLIYNIYQVKIADRISYRQEIFPFQWKISISWMSGYFIYQLFNPVLFATVGPVAAGQMGLTMQGVNGVTALSASWMNTKTPIYSRLIALKDYLSLDRLFNKTFKQMLTVTFFLYIVFLILIVVIDYMNFTMDGELVSNRFLPYIPMLLIIGSVIINQCVATLASYLRCHKQEPFLRYSVAMGIASLILIPIAGKCFGLYGVCICYFILQLTFSSWGYHIYKTKKQQWHKNNIQ